MRVMRILGIPCRVVIYFFLILVVLATGAQGQHTPVVLRIGLQTKQPTVRLLGEMPLRLFALDAQPIDLPPGTTLTFSMKDADVVVTDEKGTALLTTTNPVHLCSVPPTPIPEKSHAASRPPLISLLGPTRHYDGKSNRPYRGEFEISPHADGLTVVNIIGIEEYLLGVVASEMGHDFPLEALKAQAVAARTYAEKNVGRCSTLCYDLDDTPGCQVYGGYFSEYPLTTQAVTETADMVITYQAQLIDAVYSSTCGGMTESAEEAWGKPVPYLVSVPDAPNVGKDPLLTPTQEKDWEQYLKVFHNWNCLQPDCARIEAFRWVKLVTRKDLEAGLPKKYQVGEVLSITPLHRGTSGRITDLLLTGSTGAVDIKTESAIRNAFGKLRSSAFTIDTYNDDSGKPVVFALWGAGWGHGIGMCQVGAVGLAKQGLNYQQILQHYYTGVIIEQR